MLSSLKSGAFCNLQSVVRAVCDHPHDVSASKFFQGRHDGNGVRLWTSKNARLAHEKWTMLVDEFYERCCQSDPPPGTSTKFPIESRRPDFYHGRIRFFFQLMLSALPVRRIFSSVERPVRRFRISKFNKPKPFDFSQCRSLRWVGLPTATPWRGTDGFHRVKVLQVEEEYFRHDAIIVSPDTKFAGRMVVKMKEVSQ